MKSKGIFLLVCLVLFTCSKDDGQNESINLEASATTVLPLQVIFLKSNSITFQQETYQAKFGDFQIELIRSDDGRLILPIPNLSAGLYDLKTNIDGKDAVVQFTVEAHNITNANEVISQEVLIPLNQLNQSSTDFVSDVELSSQVINQLVNANYMYDKFVNQLQSISEVDRLELAMFFKANPILSSSFMSSKSISPKLKNNGVTDCFKKNASEFVAVALIIYAALPILSATAITPIGFIALVVSGVTAVAVLAAAQEKLLSSCFMPFMNIFKDDNESVNEFVMNDGEPKSFSLYYKMRSILSSDVNNENDYIRNIAESWDSLGSGAFNSFKNKINYIITTTSNWFTSWFTDTDSFEEIIIDYNDLPESSEEYEVQGNYFTDIITSGVPEGVEFEVINNGDSWRPQYKFTAVDKSILPISFSVKTDYTDGSIEYTSSFMVTLEENLDYASLIIGVWNLVGVESNDPNEQEVGCPFIWTFGEIQMTSVEYGDSNTGDCSVIEFTRVSDYSIQGSFIIERYNGIEYNYEILELTETVLKIKFNDGGYYYIDTYERQ